MKVLESNGLYELSGSLPNERFYNEDLAPTTLAKRTWNTWHIASLWVGMCVCTPTYMMAASLLKNGMSWGQAIFTITLGNAIVLVPMALNAHAGTKYGVPFPVLLRSSFGTVGSNIPAMARAVVACGWFGIQTWIGGSALFELGKIMYPAMEHGEKLAVLGISGWQFACFLIFWAINIYFILAGTESIKWLETLSAPVLILMGIALLGWAVLKADGLGKILDESFRFKTPTVAIEQGGGGRYDLHVKPLPGRAVEARFTTGGPVELEAAPWTPVEKINADRDEVAADPQAKSLSVQFRDAEGRMSNPLACPLPQSPGRGAGEIPFLSVFLPSLTAMVCFWATLSLNIPDFTRFAKSQKDQILGQAIGLPPTMALYAFIGLAVTASGLLIFPDVLIHEDAPWDPVKLLARFESIPMLLVSMIMLSVATLTTNIAANVVGPANDISNLNPAKISFKMGGMITALIGVLMMPWKIIETTHGYIYTWLIGYGALLGPIGGIMIADYYVLRRARLNLLDLYRADGEYRYTNGINRIAVAVLVVAVLPNVPGFLVAAGALDAGSIWGFFNSMYEYTFFVGFGIAFALYSLIGPRPKAVPA